MSQNNLTRNSNVNINYKPIDEILDRFHNSSGYKLINICYYRLSYFFQILIGSRLEIYFPNDLTRNILFNDVKELINKFSCNKHKKRKYFPDTTTCIDCAKDFDKKLLEKISSTNSTHYFDRYIDKFIEKMRYFKDTQIIFHIFQLHQIIILYHLILNFFMLIVH